MATDNALAQLYRSPKTILTIKDIALIWREKDRFKLYDKVKYYAERGSLLRLTRGVYAKDAHYDSRELATSFYTPSYLSFETVLRDAGIIFQHQQALFVASPYATTKSIRGQTFVFRALKETILYNARGVRNEQNTSIATPERAFVDMLYVSPTFHVDNPRSLNWEVCLALARTYENKQLYKRVMAYTYHAQ